MNVKNSCAILLVVGVASCATVEMPSNVSITQGDSKQTYINTIDFSYQTIKEISFNKLKLCVAEKVSNRAVQLDDASGFRGPVTGNFYAASHRQTVQGGDIFKYADATLSTLIANGTADGGSVALTRSIVKYDLKASVTASQVILVFTNISRAQKSTGYVANDGFGPVGTWSGAYPMQTYAALDIIAKDIKSCLQ